MLSLIVFWPHFIHVLGHCFREYCFRVLLKSIDVRADAVWFFKTEACGTIQDVLLRVGMRC
ncbi:MAG: hypothetical protein P8077_03640 [Gammaproteobacteria bacterium]